jgi:glycine/D-amino acid oxidase-like deaminating enzyme
MSANGQPHRDGTWYAQVAGERPARRALTHDLDTDVVVVGGGLAGLSTARELAARGYAVAVLEEDRIAGGASGRNAGFVSAGFAEDHAAIVRRVGEADAAELHRLSVEGADSVRARIVAAGRADLIAGTGHLKVQRVDDRQAARRAADRLMALGQKAAAWETEAVRAVLKSDRYFQAVLDVDGFQIDPLAFADLLTAEAESAGVRVFEGTPAVSLDFTTLRRRVMVPGATIRCERIVLAGGPSLGRLYPPVARAVLPVATYVAVTEKLGERLSTAVRVSGAVSDNRRAGDYYRIVDGDRLLWGGKITTRQRVPARLADVMARTLTDVYPQLGRVAVDVSWAGTMAYAVHRMPIIGQVQPGLYVATGFGGHGLNTTAIAGRLIAAAIAEGDERWRLFAPFGLVPAGGSLGRAATQVVYWSMQARDRVQEWRARADRPPAGSDRGATTTADAGTA